MGNRTHKIVLSEGYSASALSRLRAVGDVIELDSCDEGTVIAALTDADALLVRTHTRVTDTLLGAGNRLKVVGRAGVGVDNIDLAAARRRGIVVVHTPSASTRSVAEHTVGLMLALEHRLLAGDHAVRDDRFFVHRDSVTWRELDGCSMGIVGMGRIGSAVARMCADGFGMKILYNDIRRIGPFGFDAVPTDLDDLLRTADFVSLHVPLTSQTRGLIGDAQLSLLKPTSMLINTSRGAVVDGVAVASALERGAIAGAALDVFEDEPVPAGHPILSAPNTLLTPHIAGRSSAALIRMNDVVDDVIAVLERRSPKHPVEIT
ncbi:MAG: hydroxyacid dehydrogenase [Planctomycetes bacterium]|nr:hydroxyacid dehydrogenase [Planctomycetota bacterium]